MTKLILIVGLTGAGKTTYSDELYSKEKCTKFSIDQLMKDLYWQDMPKNPDMKWFIENQVWYTDRIARCENYVKNQVLKNSKVGISSILDLGFSAVSHRMVFLNLAEALSLKAEIHFLDISKNERWKRVQNRNENEGSTFSMKVTREMFDYMESIFEPLSDEEEKYKIECM